MREFFWRLRWAQGKSKGPYKGEAGGSDESQGERRRPRDHRSRGRLGDATLQALGTEEEPRAREGSSGKKGILPESFRRAWGAARTLVSTH